VTTRPGRRLTAVAFLAAALSACTGPDTPPVAPPTASPAPPVDALRARGDERLARGHWEGAAGAYREALAQRPDDGAVRYRLAVALANLDRVDEAEPEFRWVVEHDAPGAEEVQIAREWLAALRPAAAERPEAGTEAAGPEGRLEGRTEWAALEPGRSRPRLQLLLTPTDGRGGGRRYGARALLGEPYRFTGVAPGRYRLTAQVGMTRLWDTTVEVQAGKTATVNLTPATSVASPNALRLQPT